MVDFGKLLKVNTEVSGHMQALEVLYMNNPEARTDQLSDYVRDKIVDPEVATQVIIKLANKVWDMNREKGFVRNA